MFDTIKGLVGNSAIVGIGAGRSGAGYGVIAGLEALDAQRGAYNVSYWRGSGYTKHEVVKNGTGTIDNSDYKNQVLTPAPYDLKGGDGAVIIVW